jgi:F0F1-type ATP synthase assembly protein I
MLLYPVVVIVLAIVLSGWAWLWAIAALCGLAWIGAVSVFLATTFRREGYQAAIDDQDSSLQP